MPETCVILPVYNELHHIQRTIDQVVQFSLQNPSISFLLVDDGSTDGTREFLLAELTPGKYERIKPLSYQPNQGKGYAVKLGLHECEAKYYIFTDGDLPYSLDYLPAIIADLASHELVIGTRQVPQHPDKKSSPTRHFLGRGFNFLVRTIVGLPYQDTQAGIKGFQRDAARRIFRANRIVGFGFDVEILFLAKKYGFGVQEIEVKVENEHSYKEGKIKLLRDSCLMFLDLIRIHWYNWLGDYDSLAIAQGEIKKSPPLSSLSR